MTVTDRAAIEEAYTDLAELAARLAGFDYTALCGGRIHPRNRQKVPTCWNDGLRTSPFIPCATVTFE